MANDIKDGIKKIAKETEVKLTGFLLRWKDQREGKEIPDDDAIDRKSRIVADKANEIFKRRGKTIFNEIKNVYIKKKPDEEDRSK
jgi:nitrogenase subunit NifH